MTSEIDGLTILVGVHGGGLNGIDTYAENVALAAALTGHRVHLVASTPEGAHRLRLRLPPEVTVEDLGLDPPGPVAALLGRLWHGVAMARLAGALEPAVAGRTFDVAHLNHPALAPTARRAARSVVVAAWFHPHRPFGRMAAAWRHARGFLPRRLVLTVKGLSYWLGDRRGFAAADLVVAPTETLAAHLRTQGVPAAVCPPPVRPYEGPRPERAAGVPRILVAVAGDLGHPRKNLRDALAMLTRLPATVKPVRLVLIGKHPEALEPHVPEVEGVEVVFTGPLPPDTVREYVSGADVLVFPSLYEEWGYAAVEALTSGVPVATYPVYPFGDMLTERLGVVARRRDPEALAEAVEAVLRGDCRPDVAEAARARFGAEAVGRWLDVLWREGLRLESGDIFELPEARPRAG